MRSGSTAPKTQQLLVEDEKRRMMMMAKRKMTEIIFFLLSCIFSGDRHTILKFGGNLEKSKFKLIFVTVFRFNKILPKVRVFVKIKILKRL